LIIAFKKGRKNKKFSEFSMFEDKFPNSSFLSEDEEEISEPEEDSEVKEKEEEEEKEKEEEEEDDDDDDDWTEDE